ncbi:MadR family response regulator transcription factor [Nocardioides kongjuensis]|uniref:DNA-binding NarL/FixJ family response regulator n=1 Tax=Nocardioides kongjuensis TaxID=349522 RepID=A0A852RLN1_9ACTN|nr:response regulator transcription factor [Nocardioides kongjuensis]NYD31945.1 DNA-binding NarL/FixJ family response regulator [Nocardioides kongjuensis]
MSATTIESSRAAERPDTIGVVLVDDHAIVRQGLRSVLEREADLSVVGEAATPAQAVAVVAAARPDVVLLDLRLSPSSDNEGIELCTRLHQAHPELALLVLTTVIDDQLVLEAIHQGARGYVVKEVDTSELVRAIRAVHRGDSAFDSRSAAAMVRGINAETAAENRRLTDREQDVLRLLARGMSNRDIGRQLFISDTTAKFHVSNIMRKLQVSRRAEAVYVASKDGLI